MSFEYTMAYLALEQDGLIVGRFELLGRICIGRGTECDLRLDDAAASRHHCIIEPTRHGWVVKDLASTNGTHVGGIAVHELALAEGDRLRVGNTLLRFYEGIPPKLRPAGPHDALAPHTATDPSGKTVELSTPEVDRPIRPFPVPRPTRS